MAEFHWERIPKAEYKHIITLIDSFNYAGLINIAKFVFVVVMLFYLCTISLR